MLATLAALALLGLAALGAIKFYEIVSGGPPADAQGNARAEAGGG